MQAKFAMPLAYSYQHLNSLFFVPVRFLSVDCVTSLHFDFIASAHVKDFHSWKIQPHYIVMICVAPSDDAVPMLKAISRTLKRKK